MALRDNMRDLKSTAAMWTKAVLFLLIGLTASILLLLEVGTLRGALLLAVTVWAFCRAYYFAFYVIEKYVDPEFRFAGLFAFGRYLIRRMRQR